MEKRKKKNRFFRIIAVIIIFAIWFYNNLTLNQTYFRISSNKINSDVKIAVISDLHHDKIHVSTSIIKSALKKNKPNIIFILGDMYTNGSSERIISSTSDFIISLTEICPVYFVSGEHDRDSSYIDTIKNGGVNIMNYQTRTIWIDKNQIQIYGIDNVYFSNTFNLENEFEKPDPDVYSILLAHIPQFRQYQQFGTNLTICGDTHGGIVQFPILGCAYYEGNWLPEIFGDKSEVYDKGLFKTKTGYMFITSGIGNNPVPARFCNRPEVAFITLSPAEKK